MKYRIGVDDSGRGALAGPLIFCAFFHRNPERLIELGAKDSKKTSIADRKALYALLLAEKEQGNCLWIVSSASSQFIDELGYTTAESSRIRTAVDLLVESLGLELPQTNLYIDGLNPVDNLPEGLNLIEYLAKGEDKEPTIAAASIVAKYTHDQYIDQLHAKYPDWGFDSHRAYAAPEHRRILYERGPLPEHRVRASSTALKNHMKKLGLTSPHWLP